MEELTSTNLEGFLDQTASRSPTPGGGSVTAAAGALAVSLARMVAAYSVNKKTEPEVCAKVEAAATQLLRLDHLLRALITRDAVAYGEMTSAAKEAKADPNKREAYEKTVVDAVAVPMEIAALASRSLTAMDELKDVANAYLLSDLGIAAVLADATVKAAWYTVRVNSSEIADPATRSRLLDELASITKHAEQRRQSVEAFVRGHLER